MNESLELNVYRAGIRQSPVDNHQCLQASIEASIEASSPKFTENLYPTFLP